MLSLNETVGQTSTQCSAAVLPNCTLHILSFQYIACSLEKKKNMFMIRQVTYSLYPLKGTVFMKRISTYHLLVKRVFPPFPYIL